MISKRTRFEVFKRDSFTCQYCGRKAPDVILHVDHIEPRASGGSDELLNLITSCIDCNSGKSDKRLSDSTVVAKHHAQLAALQERQEQLAMLIEWQRSLADLDDQAVTEAEQFWCELVAWQGLSATGRKMLKTSLRRHGIAEVMTAMRIAADQYVDYERDETMIKKSTEDAFRKIGGICRVRSEAKAKPWLQDLFYIRGILRKRLSYVNDHEARDLLQEAFELGATAEELQRLARDARNWTNWRESIVELNDVLKSERPPGEKQYNPYD